MTGNRSQRDVLSRLELEVAARGVDDGRERVDMRDVEPPREQFDEPVLLCLRRRRVCVVADQRYTDRAGVEALRVRTDHVLVHAAAATLVDRPEAVDQKVVADVVPAVSLHVVDLDAANDRCRLGLCVRVRSCGVVHDSEPVRGCKPRLRAHDLLVGAPARTRDDRRCPRRADAPDRLGRDTRPELIGTQATHVALRAELHAVGRGGPVEVALVPAAGPAVGRDVSVGCHPGRPPAVQTVHAIAHDAASDPVHGEHVEVHRRLYGVKRPRPERHLLHAHGDLARAGERGDGKRRKSGDGDNELLHTATPWWNGAGSAFAVGVRSPLAHTILTA